MPFVGNVDRLRYIYRIKPTRPAMLTDGPTAAEATLSRATSPTCSALPKLG
jgi:hypothetical protein